MRTLDWQLHEPISAVIFDCDGTLSTIEGIDELARQHHSFAAVQALTAQAMGQSGINLDLYQQRLNLVRPTQAQVAAVGLDYIAHAVPYAKHVIQLFQALNKSIYIISAGLLPAVAYFAESLSIPRENIFAVDIQFDAHGNYLSFDDTSPLVTSQGKRAIVSQLKQKHAQTLYIGDGLNDVAVQDLVTRFVGFGGAYYRENIERLCNFYIKTLSMAPLLPLALTKNEYEQLSEGDKTLFHQGLLSLG